MDRAIDTALEHLLVLRFQAGDERAFEDLVSRYGPSLGYFVRKILGGAGGAGDSDDVLQEVWIDVFRKIGRLRSPASFRSWLYRIARDRAFGELRRMKKLPKPVETLELERGARLEPKAELESKALKDLEVQLEPKARFDPQAQLDLEAQPDPKARRSHQVRSELEARPGLPTRPELQGQPGLQGEPRIQGEPAEQDGPEPEFTAEDAEKVHASLEALAPEHREVLLLRFLEGMRYEEIAATTGCAVGTVRSRLHYAKLALRRAIERRERKCPRKNWAEGS